MLEKFQNLVTVFGNRIAKRRLSVMHRLLLVSTIFSILVLSWVIPRWTAPKNCISSSFIEQISLPDSQKVISACDLRVRTLGETPAEWLLASRLIARVDAFETYRFLLPEVQKKLRIIIAESRPNDLLFGTDELTIGKNLLQESGVLEKAILVYWYNHSDPMAAHIISEFTWAYLSGHLGGVRALPEPWLLSYADMSGYCLRGVPLYHHHEYCNLYKELGDGLVQEDLKGEARVWSLNQIYSKILVNLYKKSSVETQRLFLERLLFLNTFEELSEHYTQNEEPNLEVLDAAFMKVGLTAFMTLGLEESDIQDAIEPYLMRNARKVPYLVMSDVEMEIPKAMPNALLESSKATKTFYPSGLEVHVSRHEIFNYLDISEVLFVGCEPPQVRALLDFEPYVRTITFVKVCDDSKEQLAELLNTGVKRYLQLKPNTSFIEFNLKALKVTKNLKGLPSSVRADIYQLADWLESQAEQFDEGKKAYRLQSAYAGINYYRWQ
jgi:hypothetical protein